MLYVYIPSSAIIIIIIIIIIMCLDDYMYLV
jgi:hypothetical protein